MVTTGQQLSGRYELISPLGKGGMGVVYRAHDLRLRRDVAVKILPDHLANDKEALSRFEREATAIAALSHPNILAIHDFGTDQDVSFAVMELLEGETLGQRLHRSPLSWQQAVAMAIWIADGLSAAHSKGIIHRDIKPDNIFLTSDQHGKILDFGLARREHMTSDKESSQVETETVTRAGTVMGTVPYMSPEQVRGETVDARSDIFSFGGMFFEMIAGKRPFDRGSSAETVSAILRDDPPSMADSGVTIPPGLEGIIRRCLQRKPEDRYQSVRDLILDLKAVLQGSPMPHVLTSASPPSARIPLWAAALLVVVIAAAGFVAYLQPWRKETGAPPEAERGIQSLAILPFMNEGGNPDTEYLSDGITDSIMNKLSGLSNLKVLAHDTVFTYKGKQRKPQDVGRELNVGAIVTGRVLQHENELVIRVELIQVSDGTQLWGEQYQRKPDDVLSIQEDISRVISEKLQLRLTEKDQQRLRKRDTDDPEAQRLYLKGKYYLWKNTEEDYEKARAYFQQAIDKDPAFALAYQGLGHYYGHLAIEGYVPAGENFPKAEAAYKKAQEIDETLDIRPGMSIWRDWNCVQSEKEAKLMLVREPGSPIPHWQYYFSLLCLGRVNEALQQIKQAQELDPLSLTFSVNAAQILTLTGRYDDAIKELQRIIKVDPDYVAAHLSLAQAYEEKGMYEGAISESQKAYLLAGDDNAAALFENARGASGYKEAKKAIAQATVEGLKELAKEKYVSPLEFARLYSQLNQKDEAFRWLEKAYQEHSPQMVLIRVTRDYDNLQSDPRFADLVRRLGLH